MTIEQVRKLLGEQTLDSATDEGYDTVYVEFGPSRSVSLFVEGDTFRVGSTTTAKTRELLDTADAYSRAASFIRRAKLRPA